MMSKRMQKQYDELITEVNNITPQQLEGIDLQYLKVKREGRYLIIMGHFYGVFLARLNEITGYLDRLEYPNLLFKCYAVLVLDLWENRYVTHRLYSFPINPQLYKMSESSSFKSFLADYEENPMILKVNNDFTLRSKIFKIKQPLSRTFSTHYDIKLANTNVMYFDIDNYVDKYIKVNGNGINIVDTWYHRGTITKQQIIDSIECDCKEERKELEFACNSCDNADQRNNCNIFHSKKCRCGKWTYFREENCLKCHLIYSKSNYMTSLFTENHELWDHLIKQNNNIRSFIPFYHYNQGSSGLCLGNGNRVINNMLDHELNPIKLMLAFKANLAFTDHDRTTNYYKLYKQRLQDSQLDNHNEFYGILNAVFINDRKYFKRHVFSMRCFCPQCFFYRIVVKREGMKLDPKGFIVDQPPIVTRTKFIEIYTKYLKNLPSKSYQDTYIHQLIKEIVNTPVQDQLEIIQ